MKIPIYSLCIIIGTLITACNQPEPESPKAITTKQVQNTSFFNVINEEEEEEDNEYYFSDSKGKTFYSQHSGNQVSFRTTLLLESLFKEAKSELPRISRKKKLNISLEVKSDSRLKKEVLSAAQNFILTKKKFQLANTDEEALAILRDVLKKEQDSLYEHQQDIATKKASDIVLVLYASKNKKKMLITGQIYSKNATLLGQKTNETYITEETNKNKEWVDVSVPRSAGGVQVFEIMRNAISMQQYTGIPSSKPVSNVNYIIADKYCREQMQAQLSTPYVFENARKSLAMSRPSSPITQELISFFDEDDDIYFMKDDYIGYSEDDEEDNNDDPITFDWNSEKYYPVSKVFKSKNTTFRCIRAKQ